MVDLHYLKHAFDRSDGEAESHWVENPYWQYFCGEEYFQHEFPIDPSLMTKWRNRVKSKELEKLLQETVKAGLKIKAIRSREMRWIVVDTTVQEKAMAFPTDACINTGCLRSWSGWRSIMVYVCARVISIKAKKHY